MSNNPIGAIEYNAATLPKSIYKYFCSLGHESSYYKTEGKEPVYGDKIPPFKMLHSYYSNKQAWYCYINEYEYERFESDIEKGILKDKSGLIITEEIAKEYLTEYAKGFNVGYLNFEKYVLKGKKLDLENIDIIYMIFERVYGILIEKGSIRALSIDISEIILVSFQTKVEIYQQGVLGGEYYRAWEIIIAHPLRFKQLFDDAINKEKSENPATDLQNINPHPLIFRDSNSYNLFLELKNLTVKKSTENADFSFIYHSLKNKNISAIHDHVTQIVFIDLVNELYNADIGEKRLKFRKPISKLALLTTLLKKYGFPSI